MNIVILGAGGRLGAAFMREYRDQFDVTGFDRAQLDLSSLDEIRKKLGALDFDLLINTAAFTDVDLCEKQKARAFLINAEAPGALAEICRGKNAKLIHFSPDYVFDGEKREPYRESDPANPINVYGESKREGEKLVLQTHDRHLCRWRNQACSRERTGRCRG
jgi:dTDP-4-dehydrorhamnose reductase